ncbi:uncharacterized protein E0L32_012302 [Thyridium curvatum]|uniref:Cytochrome P450 n=1 Tax=Thyridium curvatum TaxID=1093900 RepID=A0A507B1R4_9PEZI|nr:uncharacterized protein E0L32_012302 [Thyridium curvatum]TPX17045.1 hypothetical protein E0L32_012302 [Thyridium curvatum]
MAAYMHVSSPTGVVGILTGLLVLYAVSRCVYNLYFHPLRNYPGPFLHRVTRLAWVWRLLRGTMSFDVLEFHNKYGPVVRVAPDELAFLDAQGWSDIYGHRTGSKAGTEELSKALVFYLPKGQAPAITTENRENHTVLRRLMSHGFSERSMREQEPIIGGYVDLLIQRMRERCVESDAYSDEPLAGDAEKQGRPKAIDLRQWYNFTTFDIIGDLAFGEPFGMLENARYDSWVELITETMRTLVVLAGFRYLGLETVLAPFLWFVQRSRREHLHRVKEKLERRMALDVERPDFIEGLLKKKDEWNLSLDRLQSNANTLIVAGSETTATLLTGVTYLLLSHPEALKKVTAEVRTAFAAEEDITLTSVGKLTYMLACLNEAMRCYPPVPIGLPRVVGRGGTTIAGHEVPEKTYVACWQYAQYHSTANWTEPFEYKPERFLEGSKNPADRHDTLQPFSVGPRNCIGRKYVSGHHPCLSIPIEERVTNLFPSLAYAEMRLILAKILYNFDMRLADPNFNWLDQKAYLLWNKPALNVYLTPVR